MRLKTKFIYKFFALFLSFQLILSGFLPFFSASQVLAVSCLYYDDYTGECAQWSIEEYTDPYYPYETPEPTPYYYYPSPEFYYPEITPAPTPEPTPYSPPQDYWVDPWNDYLDNTPPAETFPTETYQEPFVGYYPEPTAAPQPTSPPQIEVEEDRSWFGYEQEQIANNPLPDFSGQVYDYSYIPPITDQISQQVSLENYEDLGDWGNQSYQDQWSANRDEGQGFVYDTFSTVDNTFDYLWNVPQNVQNFLPEDIALLGPSYTQQQQKELETAFQKTEQFVDQEQKEIDRYLGRPQEEKAIEISKTFGLPQDTKPDKVFETLQKPAQDTGFKLEGNTDSFTLSIPETCQYGVVQGICLDDAFVQPTPEMALTKFKETGRNVVNFLTGGAIDLGERYKQLTEDLLVTSRELAKQAGWGETPPPLRTLEQDRILNILSDEEFEQQVSQFNQEFADKLRAQRKYLELARKNLKEAKDLQFETGVTVAMTLAGGGAIKSVGKPVVREGERVIISTAGRELLDSKATNVLDSEATKLLRTISPTHLSSPELETALNAKYVGEGYFGRTFVSKDDTTLIKIFKPSPEGHNLTTADLNQINFYQKFGGQEGLPKYLETIIDETGVIVGFKQEFIPNAVSLKKFIEQGGKLTKTEAQAAIDDLQRIHAVTGTAHGDLAFKSGATVHENNVLVQTLPDGLRRVRFVDYAGHNLDRLADPKFISREMDSFTNGIQRYVAQ